MSEQPKEKRFDYKPDTMIGVLMRDDKDLPATIEGTMVWLLMDIRRELKELNKTVKATRFMAFHAPPEESDGERK